MGSRESQEEYLETLFKLDAGEGGATVTRLAKELGVKPASASEMVARLLRTGMVKRDDSSRTRIVLTAEGRSEAVRLVRCHRLSERFLTDCLDLPWDEVHEEACKFEHVFSAAVETSLARRLGYPLTCPHGRAIPYEGDAPSPEATRTLAELRSGESCTVSHISDEKPEFLRYLAALGLYPEAKIEVREVAPFEGPLTIEVGGASRPIGREVARKVFIR